MLKRISIFVFCLLWAWPVLAQGAEVIKKFDSQITVNTDASLLVKETITVNSTGDQIQHGIYRDFPTIYNNPDGSYYEVGFKIVSIKRDGQPAKYDTEGLSNGIRIYIRDRNYDLPRGLHTFEITYQTTGQLGFFADHDELYWNVTGNGWAFPIEQASAEVTLPAGISADQIKTTAYTGYQGDRGQDFQSSVNGTQVDFNTTRGLRQRQGFTIVVGWPSGIVTKPPRIIHTKSNAPLVNYDGLVFGVIAIVIILLYYLITWFLVGRDPKKGTIIPLYEPPQELSPAAISYIRQMGFVDKAFVATIINLAVKGFWVIKKEKSVYILNKTEKDPALLTAEETAVMENLFENWETTRRLTNKAYEKISATREALKNFLISNYRRQNFYFNGIFFIIGLIISAVLTFVIVVMTYLVGPVVKLPFIFIVFWLIVWTIVMASALYKAVVFGKSVFNVDGGNSWSELSSAVISTMVALIISPLFLLFAVTLHSVYLIIIVMLITVINLVFLMLLRARTPEGRKLMDEIEGFKWFLSVTEKDRMNFHNPPEKTPELFEKYLPYALALGVENKWAEQFTEVFRQLEQAGNSYQPGWYVGANFSAMSISAFASGLGGAFAGAVSSAATAPGSGSGFGGGGGSGGGGGGGGGGGC